MILYKLKLTLACLLGMSLAAIGQQQGTVSKIETDGLTYFRAIKSGSCRAILEYVVDSKGKPNQFKKIADIDYGVEGNRLFFDYVQSDPKYPWSERTTYDGKQQMYFDRADGDAHFPKTLTACAQRDAPNLAGRNVLIEPFAFLYADHGASNPRYFLTLKDVSDPAGWKIMDEGRILPNQKLGDSQCSVIEFPGATDPVLKVAYKVRVWFDINNGNYPIQYQCITGTGKLIRQYTVSTLGYFDEREKLPYPQVAEYTEILYDENNNEISGGFKITVEDIKLNAEIGGAAFVIDPALANAIFDPKLHCFVRTHLIND